MAKTNPYFEDFVTLVGFSCEAAEYLRTVLKNFDPTTLPANRATMHKIEHAADQAKHGVINRLAKEFVTPIDREDIMQMTDELDNVTDTIEDIVIRLYMYNIRTVRPEALAFADVIVRCCDTLRVAMEEFHNFQKSQKLNQAIIAVNTMEEEGDAIYIDAVRRLFETCQDPLEVAAWSELFDRLEECCDACEHVADVIEHIAMKNV